MTNILSMVRAELGPGGNLRAGLNYSNFVLVKKDPISGEPRGIAVELAREIARRLDIPLEFVPFETAGRMADAVKYHTPTRSGDVAEEIYAHLVAGNIVIVDLSVGPATIRDKVSKTIAAKIFNASMQNRAAADRIARRDLRCVYHRHGARWMRAAEIFSTTSAEQIEAQDQISVAVADFGSGFNGTLAENNTRNYGATFLG